MTNNSNARGPLEKAFSAQIQYAMDLRGYSPSEVGKQTGITPGAVRSYLRGTFLPRKPVQTQLENLLQVRFNMVDSTVMVPEVITPVAPDASAAAPAATRNHLTIPEAKAALAANLGVDPSCIEISVRNQPIN